MIGDLYYISLFNCCILVFGDTVQIVHQIFQNPFALKESYEYWGSMLVSEHLGTHPLPNLLSVDCCYLVRRGVGAQMLRH